MRHIPVPRLTAGHLLRMHISIMHDLPSPGSNPEGLYIIYTASVEVCMSSKGTSNLPEAVQKLLLGSVIGSVAEGASLGPGQQGAIEAPAAGWGLAAGPQDVGGKAAPPGHSPGTGDDISRPLLIPATIGSVVGASIYRGLLLGDA